MSESSSVSAERSRSHSVLNTLYHETRHEIELLGKQICVKDNIIADLRARLGRHERIYMAVGEDEPVGFGPSSSLVESLLQEMCKLKQKRSDVELRAARQAEVRHAGTSTNHFHLCFQVQAQKTNIGCYFISSYSLTPCCISVCYI